MPEHLLPPALTTASGAYSGDESPSPNIRILSRSPHPYHRRNSELLEPADRLVHTAAAAPFASTAAVDGAADADTVARGLPLLLTPKDSTPASDSGTDADDEHFLKGLPAPKTRLHKGLRGRNEPLSGSSTPQLSPAVLEEEGRRTPLGLSHGSFAQDKRSAAEKVRRRKELVRRSTEVLLLACLAGMVASNRDVQPFLRLYQREFLVLGQVALVLLAAYPLRLVTWAYAQGSPSKLVPITIPSSFDPAPLFYPPLIPVLVSLLVAQNVRAAVLLNLALGLCALPRSLVPSSRYWEVYSPAHWLLSCLPLFVESYQHSISPVETNETSQEILALLYPLHQTLCLILQFLTTTSLLTAELQLLSVALINVLLLAQSPQAVILNGLLWGGGLGIIVFCSQVIRWGIALARVPKWRFKRLSIPSKWGSTFRLLRTLWSLRRPRLDIKVVDYGNTFSDTANSSDEYYEGAGLKTRPPPLRNPFRADSVSDTDMVPGSHVNALNVRFNLPEPMHQLSARRNTLPSPGRFGNDRSKTSTPSGRRKRSASSSVRAFFSLTQSQAVMRKWLYAGYVYLCVLMIVLVGIREYVQRFALAGYEPIGWALGYLFGDLPRFRLEVVKANIESWICLPPRPDHEDDVAFCRQGLVQHLRHSSFGEANTRLVLAAYWLAMIGVGLAVVFRLSPIYEVDTRRKVFHFMMVAMFLPATYIDPTFVSLALSLVLAIFLLLDLLRASQLPPLSKPIASFLTPFVDGRDLRGPVVISHIFLLIGCAIPLWLSLASLSRTGSGALAGWEVPTRDVSMVSGVVCVGLGDAAASLIGRRWGHRKWLWGGGKSVEGSLAFATAVFVGLMAANAWLHMGGWPLTTPTLSMTATQTSHLGGMLASLRSLWSSASLQKTAICASVASLTEAVLTGGNDNVVVPVVLWTCVKSLGV
ncbi:hypothetical protein B0T26DRAFT_821626 [Lasiosphaeria miniovina]|uniref:dolichol kinase n=1 Tax=Lasiosphaeria miniovina TaxID=1954250 RepID=A0AA40E9H1_9PEZI|nr:uncharacterized protein B0T26DRAFT_821626 [Lasiosphaeria miniovina]KAK0727308.1 hypothetical protein B0T26DRAFT_821626 [Lasiosphaeria miniovina]